MGNATVKQSVKELIDFVYEKITGEKPAVTVEESSNQLVYYVHVSRRAGPQFMGRGGRTIESVHRLANAVSMRHGINSKIVVVDE